ncbi:sirohydrochlorin chelatase [Crocosphaera chwakensis]|uniref:Cobalamin (Vitamin B12) biosynthesis CbiX protein n=1 Tax=Crocosphaera chwakensis CCY0110 TaxID=391612 RepID=A3INC3_9CHRO|nr:sirohydrochlorin chelatase [Crocosphaera chwakensis]EAZ92100.1 Cobalamin (vitamin B12) biosynthesis CbiX protein [Crocosphaera chwakensis CCY0110]
MTLTSAYLLVSHGSRDPRPQIALERLSYLVEEELKHLKFNHHDNSSTVSSFNQREKSNNEILEEKPNYYFRKTLRKKIGGRNSVVIAPQLTIVETASLELSEVSLSQKIQQFVTKLQNMGINNLKIVPLFLLPGVHVREDIPREIAIAQETINPKINIELCPYLGSYKGLIKIIARQFSSHPQNARIIIAHGSRRHGGNDSVEAIASQLNAKVAYWSIEPSLSDQVDALVKQGKTQITIVPYFLFTGGITTVIKEQVQQLQNSLPQTQLNLGQPLGATPELAQLMVSQLIDN